MEFLFIRNLKSQAVSFYRMINQVFRVIFHVKMVILVGLILQIVNRKFFSNFSIVVPQRDFETISTNVMLKVELQKDEI